MKIIVREAASDFSAFCIASGMACAGANVFSVTDSGRDDVLRFRVWASYEEPLTPDRIDAAINQIFADRKAK